jgi:hypothetical protein
MGKRSSRSAKKGTASSRRDQEASLPPAIASFDLDKLKLAPSRPLVALLSRLSPSRPFAPLIWLGIVLLVTAGVVIFVDAWNGRSRSLAPDVSGKADDGMGGMRQLAGDFQRLKNANDPAVEQLLGSMPAVPEGPISQEEAERFQADCFLRQNLHVRSIRIAPANRFVVVTKGNVSAPTLSVRTANGVDRIQRTMSNPDLIVEVRDGKIHGVRAELHSGD